MVDDEPTSHPRNFLRSCVLLLLAETPAHGYDLLERLTEFGLDSNPGGLYRALRSMEHGGLIRSAWKPSMLGPDRRLYTLTARGSRQLDASANALERIRNTIELYLERRRALRATEGP